MKQNYTLYIRKTDKRTKSGLRAISTTVWTDRDEEGMKREVAGLFSMYPAKQGYSFEYFPAMTTVKSIMNGAEVMIRTEDNGTFMDPSQERYWSM